MLSEILNTKTLPQDRDALLIGDQHFTWGQLRTLASSLTEDFRRFAKRRIGLRCLPTVSYYALLFAFETLEADLLLFDGRSQDEEAGRLARDLRLAALLTPKSRGPDGAVLVEELAGEAKGSAKSTVTILTSGTSGKPKAARHTWQSLGRPVRRNEHSSPPRWLQTYRPNLYAGLQVLLQCFLNHGTLHVPNEGWEPSETAKFIATNRIQYISATPSYWRRLLLFTDPTTLEAMRPLQITLGGEVVDQMILDSLTRHFPDARLVHIYATTELGRCFSVTDGLQGFPRKFLDAPSADGVEMRIHNNELLVRSKNAMAGYDPYSFQKNSSDDWITTGDMVNILDDRVIFTGRKTDIINVGGNKVHPVEVEQVIRSIPGVCNVRVFGKRSSISGQLVACEIVGDNALTDTELREAVRLVCQAKLDQYQRPRLINIVEQIELSAAQKMIRRETD